MHLLTVLTLLSVLFRIAIHTPECLVVWEVPWKDLVGKYF